MRVVYNSHTMVYPPIREIIHKLKFVDYLPVQANKHGVTIICAIITDTVTILKWDTRGYKEIFMLNSAEREIFLLINAKMQTIVCTLTFMSRKNSILGFLSLKKAEFLDILYLGVLKNSCLTELSRNIVLLPLGQGPSVQKLRRRKLTFR